MKAALKNELSVIYCCGERLEERKSGAHEEVVGVQMRAAFKDFSADEMKNVSSHTNPFGPLEPEKQLLWSRLDPCITSSDRSLKSASVTYS